MGPADIFTIGHSTHSYERFLGMLRSAKITAVADVRTSPFSRHQPHFNRDVLKNELRLDGISYVFLGKELGGRPSEKSLFCDGVADYEKMALQENFRVGLERVVEGSKNYRIALMCSEHDPLECHRCLLVGRALAEAGQTVRHILSSGNVISQTEIEDKLLNLSGNQMKDFFASGEERVSAAYRDQSRKVAFVEREADVISKAAGPKGNDTVAPEHQR